MNLQYLSTILTKKQIENGNSRIELADTKKLMQDFTVILAENHDARVWFNYYLEYRIRLVKTRKY